MADRVLQVGLFVAVLALPLLMLVFGVVMRRWRIPQLRHLSAFDALRGQLGRSIEVGHPAHISIGTGGIGAEDTLVTLAGASIVDSLAQEAADTGASPVVSVADGTALILAQDMLRHPYTRRGDISGYDPLAVQTLGMAPLQYAVGTMDFLRHSQPVSNVMIGSFGPEVGLIIEAGVRQGLAQVAGSTDARALALLYPSANHVLIGEEIFAAPAYLERRPDQLGRLQAQDMVRYFLIFVIIVAAVLRTFFPG
ncbi:MAG TPA: DUF6754 domain-containing protein [Anaerolineae bacterium]